MAIYSSFNFQNLSTKFQCGLSYFLSVQEMKREMTCQEMSVDYINQCELKQVGFDSHTCRYKHTAFAESLGHVSLRWLTLQAQLKKQVTLLSLLVKKKNT